jgi:hypothetical protein
MQVGSQQFASRSKQADIYDARGVRVGFINQYSGGSFTVYFNHHLDESSNLFNNFMQVRNFLTRMLSGGAVEWH